MDPVSEPRPPLGAWSLVLRSLQLLVRHFGFLFPLAFVPALVVAGLTALLGFGGGPAEPARFNLAFVFLLTVDILVSFLITGVLCLAALDALLDKRHTLGEYLSQTLRHLAPIVGLGLLVSLAAGFGAVLLFLPGLYLFARYLPWTAAVVFENAGWSGLGRAQALTAGYRWPIVGALLMLGLVLIGAFLALIPLLGLVAGSGPLAVLVEAAVSGVTYALIAIFTALVYLRLREVQEGASLDAIAASID